MFWAISLPRWSDGLIKAGKRCCGDSCDSHCPEIRCLLLE